MILRLLDHTEVFIGLGAGGNMSQKSSQYLYLRPDNITEYSFHRSDKQVFLSEKSARKANINLSNYKLDYGDYLLFFEEDKAKLVEYREEFTEHVIVSDDFIVLRTTNTFIKQYLSINRYKKQFLNKITVGEEFGRLLQIVKNYQIDISTSPLVEEELEIEETPVDTEISNQAKSEKINFSDIRMIQKSQGLSTIISRLKEGEIRLDTHFQRKSYLWEEDKMCKFIESILLGFPVPAFYFDATDEDSWLIVDGLQRLSTIKRFAIDNELELSDLDYLTDLEGKKWDDLDRKEQRRLLEFEIVVYLIDEGTPKHIKYNLFKRINSGALPLNEQEIRHALNQGLPADTVKRFSEFEEFKDYVDLGEKAIQRMEDREIVLRYFAFQLANYSDYSGNIKVFLDEGMDKIANLSKTELKDLEINFRHSLRIAHQLFGEHIFKRSIIDEQPKNRRFSKVLFEPWMYALASLPTDKRSRLTTPVNKRRVISIFKGLMRGEDVGSQSEYEFDNLINKDSYTKERLQKRFKAIEELVSNVIS